jgi:hypothetical protein
MACYRYQSSAWWAALEEIESLLAPEARHYSHGSGESLLLSPETVLCTLFAPPEQRAAQGLAEIWRQLAW